MLHERGDEASLGGKLHGALMKADAGAEDKRKNLLAKIRHSASKGRKAGKWQVRRRQVLWVIKQLNGVETGTKITFDLTALADFPWQGDAFLEEWAIHLE